MSTLCNGVSGSISPWVTLSSLNNTDPNSQYHDFRAFANDSRPDWYFESMTIMHWNNCVGYIGYTPQEIKSNANLGSSLGIYDGLVCDLTDYINYPPAVITPTGMQAGGGVDTAFMSEMIVDLFKYNSGQDLTRKINGGLCYVSPLFFSPLTSFLGQPTASHCPFGCDDLLHPHFSFGCANLYLPVPSCVSAMLTCVRLCLWQPIAFPPLTSCSARCLSEAVRTIVYKP